MPKNSTLLWLVFAVLLTEPGVVLVARGRSIGWALLVCNSITYVLLFVRWRRKDRPTDQRL